MPTRTADSRNGIRQPQDRNASPGSRVTMASTTVDSTAPAGAPMLAKLAEKPRLFSSECSSAISAAPPHSPPTAKPWISRSRISRIGARTPMVCVGGEQADREAGRAHDAHGQHEHGFAADPVAEVAEDHPAQGADDVADGEGAERGDGGDHRGQVGEEQLPEHQRGGGAVEQEVVELDGAAQEAGEQHPAHLLGIAQGRRRAVRRWVGCWTRTLLCVVWRLCERRLMSVR